MENFSPLEKQERAHQGAKLAAEKAEKTVFRKIQDALTNQIVGNPEEALVDAIQAGSATSRSHELEKLAEKLSPIKPGQN